MFILYLISHQDESRNAKLDDNVHTTMIIFCSLIGFIDSFTWIGVHQLDSTSSNDFRDISDALRYEFISCTQQGIHLAVKKWEEDVEEEKEKRFDPKDYNNALKSKRVKYAIYAGKTKSGHDKGDNLRRKSVYVREKEQTYSFTGYGMALFDEVRRVWGMTTERYLDILNGDPHKMKQNFSDGRSGSFFYFSIDRRFMVKTLTKGEYKLLLDILIDYVNYVRRNPESFLCRFYGMYSIRMYGHRQYFVVMHNCLRTIKPELAPNAVYDLKGSSIGRYTKTHIKGKQKKKVGVMKDNNLSMQDKILVPSKRAAAMIDQLQLDSLFLSNLNIMDYSLLLGIHYCSSKHFHDQCLESASRSLSMAQPAKVEYKSSHKDFSNVEKVELEVMVSQKDAEFKLLSDRKEIEKNMYYSSNVVGPGLYYIGVIDILQGWNLKKKMELFAKIIFLGHCFDYKELSVAEPKYYRERFMNMVRNVIPYTPEDNPEDNLEDNADKKESHKTEKNVKSQLLNNPEDNVQNAL